MNCEFCGKPLPPSLRQRRFCSDSHRKAAKRAEVAPEPRDGMVTAAVRAALAEYSFDAIDAARAAVAVQAARLVDGGSVSAMRELRVFFAEICDLQDPETLAFWEAIQTPGLRPDGAG